MKRTSDKKVFLVASIIDGAVAFFAWVSFIVHAPEWISDLVNAIVLGAISLALYQFSTPDKK